MIRTPAHKQTVATVRGNAILAARVHGEAVAAKAIALDTAIEPHGTADKFGYAYGTVDRGSFIDGLVRTGVRLLRP